MFKRIFATKGIGKKLLNDVLEACRCWDDDQFVNDPQTSPYSTMQCDNIDTHGFALILSIHLTFSITSIQSPQPGLAHTFWFVLQKNLRRTISLNVLQCNLALDIVGVFRFINFIPSDSLHHYFASNEHSIMVRFKIFPKTLLTVFSNIPLSRLHSLAFFRHRHTNRPLIINHHNMLNKQRLLSFMAPNDSASSDYSLDSPSITMPCMPSTSSFSLDSVVVADCTFARRRPRRNSDRRRRQ